MRQAIDALFISGEAISPTRGKAIELRGVTLELTNPRARLSRSESRGRLFSCLGELCWYLSGKGTLDSVRYYISKYPDDAEPDGLIHGAYGPRLFNYDGVNQVNKVISILRTKPDSRQAVIQIFDHDDVILDPPFRHVPCTCLLQFFVRTNRLEAITYMRSNDIYRGFPHDIFAFTMIQEIIARSLGVDVGTYVHMVGSLHLYDSDESTMRAYIAEGWQSHTEMLPMPAGDPWPSLTQLIKVERELREGAEYNSLDFDGAAYWQDLVKILAIWGLEKRQLKVEIPSIRQTLSDPSYDLFLTDKFGA